MRRASRALPRVVLLRDEIDQARRAPNDDRRPPPTHPTTNHGPSSRESATSSEIADRPTFETTLDIPQRPPGRSSSDERLAVRPNRMTTPSQPDPNRNSATRIPTVPTARRTRPPLLPPSLHPPKTMVPAADATRTDFSECQERETRSLENQESNSGIVPTADPTMESHPTSQDRQRTRNEWSTRIKPSTFPTRISRFIYSDCKSLDPSLRSGTSDAY